VPAASDKAIITEAANRYGIRPDILYGLYGTETSFGKNVSTSSAGAVGPFQFEPATAKGMGVNPYDFKSAAFGAARYLAQYKSRGIGGMLSAYNAGPAGGYQSGYVDTTLRNAKSYGSAPGVQIAPTAPQSPSRGLSPAPAAETPSFDRAGFQKAQRASLVGKLIASEGGAASNPLIASGLATTKAPLASEYTTSSVPGVGHGVPGVGVKRETPTAVSSSGKLGGFLPANAELSVQRVDQGQDIRTNPGGAIVAPGDGEVIAVKSDPSGFGPDYPVVKFSSGPMAGTSWYLGHTHSALKAGEHFKAGETLSHTGRGPGPVGNATVPGWAEIGLSGALGSGNMQAGRATERYLRAKH
jgi:Transglycosylase SLT domain